MTSRSSGARSGWARLCSVAALLACVGANGSAIAQSPPLEVKGIALGVTAAEAEAKLPGLECKGSECILVVDIYSSKKCGYTNFSCKREVDEQLKFGPTFAKYYFAEIADGKIGSLTVTYHQAGTAALVIALTEKYGKPSSDATESIQNRAGATFENRIVKWSRTDGEIKVEQRSSNIDEGRVNVATRAHLDAKVKEFVDKAKSSAKGL